MPVVQQSAASATPVVGSNVVMQSRRLYVGNIPFGVSEVTTKLLNDILNQNTAHTNISFLLLNKTTNVVFNDGLFQPTNEFDRFGAVRRHACDRRAD